MRESDLTPEQANILRERVRGMLAYFHKLRRRMEQRRFPPNDPLWLQVDAAYQALFTLHVSLHYLSCPSGTAQVRRRRGDSP